MGPDAEETRTHALELGHGLEMYSAFPALDGTVEVTLTFHGHRVFHKTFSPDQPTADFEHDHEHLRADGRIELDAFAGELYWSGHLGARPPGGDWHMLVDVDRDVLFRFSPAVGEVAGSPVVQEPVVADPGFGSSQLCTPVVLRIFVDDQDRAVAEVGKIVKQRMFPDHPGFVFNTVACVGRVPDGTPGLYGDPNSIWFNVFLGYYQLDAPKSDWTRPFAYKHARGIDSEVELEDIVRLGKSDWNWFSNWMYGVPTDHVVPFSGIDMRETAAEQTATEKVGATAWHGARISNVVAASTYEADAPGAARLTCNTIVDDIWRNSFGLPNPQPGHPESFIPTTFDAQVLMAYWEDDAAYHTLILGGTSPPGAEPRFLGAQMDAARRVIEDGYSNRGFAPA
jgi:hypothetical protein